MRAELGHGVGIALFALVTAAAAENVFQPGVQHVCVPNTDHSGWDCGTVDKPPPGYRKPAATKADRADPPLDQGTRAGAARPRGGEAAPTHTEAATDAQDEPAQTSRASPPPPPFLANPNRPRYPLPAPQRGRPATRPAVLIAPAPVQQPAPAAEVTTSTAAAQADPAAAATVAADAAPTSVPGGPKPSAAPPAVQASVPQPVAVVTAPAPTAATFTAGPAKPEVTATSDQDRAGATATTQRAAVAPRPGPGAGRPLLAALPGARAFAALSADHYTLQLAGAASAAAFPELIERLAIDYQHCYVLHLDRDGGDWWLLVYGDFSDLAAARAAVSGLPRDPALAAVWPRRIGFLQAEFVPGGNG